LGDHHNKEFPDIKQTVNEYSNDSWMTSSFKVTYSQKNVQKGPSK